MFRAVTLALALLRGAHSLATLDLPLGATCESHGVNGTCVQLSHCATAYIAHLYEEAGFEVGGKIEAPGALCSRDGEPPIVCCTDCNVGTLGFTNKVVVPLGNLIDKKDSVAWSKCYEYYKRLPYPCRGQGNVHLKRTWSEEKQCHEYKHGVAYAVGGRDAERWEFPHMALLGYGESVQEAQWVCGGTVISERYLLTAAHCSSTHTLGPIKFAALGLLRRTDPQENWKVYNIKRIIKHPEYSAPHKYDDIALLETDREIIFGKDLLPACLDLGDRSTSPAEASGWGRVGHRSALADTLQVVFLDAYEERECARAYPVHRHLPRGYDHTRQACYGSQFYVMDTCEGDSGGPLQVNEFKCLYRVVGVTSYGKNCGTPGAPGVYTRVQHYVPWIESVVWPPGGDPTGERGGGTPLASAATALRQPILRDELKYNV